MRAGGAGVTAQPFDRIETSDTTAPHDDTSRHMKRKILHLHIPKDVAPILSATAKELGQPQSRLIVALLDESLLGESRPMATVIRSVADHVRRSAP